MLPEQKRKEFLKAFGLDRLAEIEAAIADLSKEADAAGLEKKQRRGDALGAGLLVDRIKALNAQNEPPAPPRIDPQAGSYGDWLRRKATRANKQKTVKRPARAAGLLLKKIQPKVKELNMLVKGI